ncbi:MAG: PAS domain-containing protein [Fimbriimonadaceae bacterium]|nr:PAS domain-containing protein [Fimbriimonadaceae bacterium]
MAGMTLRDVIGELSSLIPVALGLSIPFFSARKSLNKTSAKASSKADLEAEVVALKTALSDAHSECDNLRWTMKQTTSIQAATLERFRTTFYELPLPAFTVNDLGHVMEWNLAATSFFGRTEPEVIDHPISDILGSKIFRNDAEGMIYLVFMGVQPKPAEIELDMIDGSTRTVRWFASPIRNSSGQVVGALNTIGILPRFDDDVEART